MALITERIPLSSLELIRNQVAAVLLAELQQQSMLYQGVDDTLSALLAATTIWSERFEPFNDNELPAVQLFFFNADYDNKHQHSQRGTYQYYLDLFTSARGTTSGRATQLASRDAHRIMMIIYGILEHPRYYNLNLPDSVDPIIQGTQLVSIKRTEEENTSSGLGAMMYRIIYEVRVTETTLTIQGVPLQESDITVRIDETDLGYQYLYTAP